MPKVLVGASCRRDPAVLEKHLQTLLWQTLPPDTTLHLCHVDDFTQEQKKPGRALLKKAGSKILSGVDQVAIVDFNDALDTTHHWEQSAFERVAQNKQLLFDKAVKEGYTHVWICDTDLLLDHTTLSSMLAVQRPCVAAVFWTRWNPGAPSQPQTWLRHPYQLDGRGLSAAEFRRRLVDKQLTRVYGLGACMLVHTDVLKHGAHYWPLLPELVAAGGMNAGEDRTFSLLCERLHVDMWADPFPDIFHVYRPEDTELMDVFLQEFQTRQHNDSLYPTYGDYVSLQIVPLEDPHVGGQSIRGRVGQLRLLPEIEQAVLGMRRGDRKVRAYSRPERWPDTVPGHDKGHRDIHGGPQAVQYAASVKGRLSTADVQSVPRQILLYGATG
jgi:hypothetical protein